MPIPRASRRPCQFATARGWPSLRRLCFAGGGDGSGWRWLGPRQPPQSEADPWHRSRSPPARVRRGRRGSPPSGTRRPTPLPVGGRRTPPGPARGPGRRVLPAASSTKRAVPSVRATGSCSWPAGRPRHRGSRRTDRRPSSSRRRSRPRRARYSSQWSSEWPRLKSSWPTGARPIAWVGAAAELAREPRNL